MKIPGKKIYAIIPARSGSKGLPNKNIRLLAGKPLLAYSIEFALGLNIDKVICSTDSEEYAQIAKQYGAEVPFLRSEYAARDTAMEEDILKDLTEKFEQQGIEFPDYIIWLRPTFVFRDRIAIETCLSALEKEQSYTSARCVISSEARLYKLINQELQPAFDDKGKSMIRRQDIGEFYKVFSTDILRFNPPNSGPDFLGRKVFGIEVDKICGLDIDDLRDFEIVNSILTYNRELVNEYL